jgi:hypothetical protein
MLILFALLLPFTVSAQLARDNLDFESWTTNSLGWTVPEGFTVSYEATENTSDPYQGSSALRITSAFNASYGDTVGIALNGTITGGSVVPGQPYTKRPDSVTGYIRTDIPVPDTAAIFYQLARYDTTGDSTQIVGSASAYLPDNVGSWSRISLDFNYQNNKTPDTLIIQYTTHYGDNPAHAGAVLEADDFQIHGAATSIEEEAATPSLSLYPNPSDGRFQVEMESRYEGTMEIRDMNGRLVEERSFNGDDRLDVRMEDAEEGVYLLNIKDENGESVAVKKVMITR